LRNCGDDFVPIVVLKSINLSPAVQQRNPIPFAPESVLRNMQDTRARERLLAAVDVVQQLHQQYGH
ncbi:MAG: hypothetical protein AAF989_04890, partial [Planctomycetota bacterium]